MDIMCHMPFFDKFQKFQDKIREVFQGLQVNFCIRHAWNQVALDSGGLKNTSFTVSAIVRRRL
jgi:hypothetical protein